MTQRAAVIDVGSNTLHLLVAEYDTDTVHAVHDLRVRTGLGARVAGAGAFGETAIHQSAAVVHRFAQRAREQGAEHLLLLATHAVRAAADREAVIAALEDAAGVPLVLLTPTGEAVLCLYGAGLDPLPQPPFLLVDIGGGSSDLALVDARGVAGACSLPAGSGVLAARYFPSDPPDASSVAAATAAVTATLAAVELTAPPGLHEILVTGGAARRLRRQYGGAVHAAQPEPAERLRPVIDRLLTEPAGRWPHPLVSAERAQITRAGAVILRAILHRWYIDAWRVSAYGLREGALRYLARDLPLAAIAAPRNRDGRGHTRWPEDRGPRSLSPPAGGPARRTASRVHRQ